MESLFFIVLVAFAKIIIDNVIIFYRYFRNRSEENMSNRQIAESAEEQKNQNGVSLSDLRAKSEYFRISDEYYAEEKRWRKAFEPVDRAIGKWFMIIFGSIFGLYFLYIVVSLSLGLNPFGGGPH